MFFLRVTSGRGIARPDPVGQLYVRHARAEGLLQRDSGYGPHFKAIGEQFGEVDLAIMENGQYDQDWKYIHMLPDENGAGFGGSQRQRWCRGTTGASCWRKHVERSVDPAGARQQGQKLSAADAGTG